MKRLILTAASALALSAAPAAAQNVQSDEPTAEELAAIGGLFGDMFGTAEPLTPEQEASMPLAMQVVTRLMPEGTMGRVMDETMAPMMDAMMGNVTGVPAIALSALTGRSPVELGELSEKNLEEAMALFDPDAGERADATNAAFLELITEIMIEVEPAYRAGLARAYATRFTKQELSDISAYFETDIGAKFAGESYIIYTDPQVMSAMNELMPSVMQRMPDVMAEIEQVSAKYPAGRSYSQLDAGEKARLADLLGVSVEELEATAPQGEVTESAYDGA